MASGGPEIEQLIQLMARLPGAGAALGAPGGVCN
jgi:hypothetical protein